MWELKNILHVQYSTIYIIYALYYLEQQTLADVKHAWLFTLSGTFVLLSAKLDISILSEKKEKSFPLIINTRMLTS